RLIHLLSLYREMISIVKSRNTKDKTFGPLAFACGYVMLLVTNQVPDAMGYLLAEFHKVCMYTVPKHLHALNAQAQNPDYYRLIGYQEEDEKPQSTESYLVNVVAYVKLYAHDSDRNQGCAASTWLSRGMEMACSVPQYSPSHHSHCFCPSCFPQDGRFRTSQEIWIAVHEDPRCNIAALHTSFERTRRKGSGRGCQQSTELSERQGLSGGAGRAVPRPAPAVESVH
uniref:mRNA export factor GLE1 n=1 Tax=Aegilops tauschii subsp. strangulata TaxID=200361 RepID=A0A452XQW0_AEGTS